MLVFLSRYLDLLWSTWFASFETFWNFSLKLFYIISSAYIVFLMMRVFARTREREQAWRLGAYSLGGSAIVAPIVIALSQGTSGLKSPFEVSRPHTDLLPSIWVTNRSSDISRASHRSSTPSLCHLRAPLSFRSCCCFARHLFLPSLTASISRPLAPIASSIYSTGSCARQPRTTSSPQIPSSQSR